MDSTVNASRESEFPGYPAPNIGAVVIGRNEGERLVRCLSALATFRVPAVYVDSSSTDGSLINARQLGATAVTLPQDRPFTAARARNFGFRVLLDQMPDLSFVLFLDGDCELEQGFVSAAVTHLQSHPEAAVVCGRRRERYPAASLYNAVCDIEWNTPVGLADACGGDAVIRSAVFSDVGGYNAELIAGEEPEMCFRMRLAGWEIHRIDHPMTIHDAAITRIGQWARRSIRSGYAYAARAWLHRRSGRRYCLKENARIIFWSLGWPLTISGLALAGYAWFASAFAALYPIQWLRLLRYTRRAHPGAPAVSYAMLLLVGNWTEFIGQLRFTRDALLGRVARIIEYK